MKFPKGKPLRTARVRAVPPLVSGPYQAPSAKIGSTVDCLRRGATQIDGYTEGTRTTQDGIPLSWPYVVTGNRRSLLLVGDLVGAVCTESEQAVAQCWGVSITVVKRWRKRLQVGRMTLGTLALWSRLAPSRLSLEARLKGSRNSIQVNAKLSPSSVREIRRRHTKGESTATLSQAYGVSSATIRRIISRSTWKHVV